MAEHYRIKLEEATRENQQVITRKSIFFNHNSYFFKLHDIVDGLNKDNDNLRAIADHCEYLTDIIEVNNNT
jgi:hypothetical protein